MKNHRQGFLGIAILIIIALALIGGGAYVMTRNKMAVGTSVVPSDAKTNPVSFTVSTSTLTLMVNNKAVQTLSLDEQGLFALNVDSSHPDAFILDKDVNFDGYDDAAVLTSTGYAGVNYFYDYYIYNPQTEKLEKSPVLMQISNPQFDLTDKKITSHVRSGSQWYTVTYEWNGSAYIASKEVPDSTVVPTTQVTQQNSLGISRYANPELHFQINLPEGDSLSGPNPSGGGGELFYLSRGSSYKQLPDFQDLEVEKDVCEKGESITINNVPFFRTTGSGYFGGMETGSVDGFYCAMNNGLKYTFAFAVEYNRNSENNSPVIVPDQTSSLQEFNKEMGALNFRFTQ
jgi:hypothetical protein